jgi:aquaporin Z
VSETSAVSTNNHLPEYFAEFLGTALMMAIGIGAVVIMWAQQSPMRELIPSDDLRRLITGMLFAGGATLVVLSPIGQRSGGHINPAVTLAFWLKGQVAAKDAACYVAAQILGAIAGVLLVERAGGEWAQSVSLGVTLPGPGFGATTAFLAEILITFLLVFLIIYCVSTQRLANKTPYLAGALVALLVFVEAPVSGTSLNPARSAAPALLSGVAEYNWIYWTAPPLGAIIAVVLFGELFPQRKRTGCAKLYHTERYRCIFADCGYTLVPAGTVVLREGEPAERAFVVERGELEVRKTDESGKEVLLSSLGPGDWAGEMGLLLKLPRSATVVAKTDSQLRTITAENFAHVIEEHPEQTLQLLNQLSKRLYDADQRIL